ncbi:uncharacterized protein BT62DRAFT_1010120 [Guyanagaster necrorhizus]|uniref:Uncharacterized protein n=1 Tax=Guyanagaster necrorhizus TaxID=856835 RepID=A0A9P7VFH4_9AGAR|nr:uncharacterized protein BT62DRAFT_1013560 [Guyanagaster necrorhizus MCA 3950]XP_043036033.1 uncharacterized protein BT62DRAFT_1010120 [Guyanagaster necrorhizus MCA 3950]KAG7439749.1 hypothetical protein BT62DRAFT_1013560 [Guyanagaster necrorhizus MCA 3950]KAG7442533.1 hypothetical protein BT62DRAFT_1010120 [Guyanagaster necrorhizus MCA 3950]
MAGLLLGAAFTAVLHHIYLFILRGHAVSGQSWIKNSNALSTLVQWLCTASVSVSLTQPVNSILYSNLGSSESMASQDLVVYPPLTIHCPSIGPSIWYTQSFSKFSTWNHPKGSGMLFLLSSWQHFGKHLRSYPSSLLTLEVGSTSPQNSASISVPTIFFSKSYLVEVSCHYHPSPSWQKILDNALQSDTLVGWNAPVGCGTECNYTIKYSAPALRCTELGLDELNTLLQGLGSPRPVYNATSNFSPFAIINCERLQELNASTLSYLAIVN